MIAATLIGQVCRVARLLITVDPVVNAHATGAEQAGDLSDRTTARCLQDSEGPSEESRIVGLTQLLLKSAALGSGQR
jgi:hypothetical protein